MFFPFCLLLLLWDPRCDKRAMGVKSRLCSAPAALLPLLQWKRWSTLWPVCATAPPHPVAMPLATAAPDYWKVPSVSSSTLLWLNPLSCAQPWLILSAPLTALTHTLFRDGVSVVFIAHSHKHWHRRQNADGDLSTARIRLSWQLRRPSQQTAGDWGKALRRPLLVTARFSRMAQKGRKVLF